MNTADSFDETIQAWQEFCAKNDWQKLIEGVTPKQTGCGPVYELPNYLERPNESFAIVDMREVKVAEPHYHPAPDVEIYLVLQGEALVVVGGEERKVAAGDAVVVTPGHVHFTVPNDQFVIAAINIPEFQPDHYITVPTDQDDPEHKFSAAQFKRLSP